ncbi:MAG TPA: hypothetical protein PLJ21_07770 [Pseudobdellovibrionaceae bacterium]|nr:hypothetical protein [Pseudobdellovibrionaceae bacterium]
MIHQLVEGQEAVVKTARSILPLVDEAHDEVTSGLHAVKHFCPKPQAANCEP